MCWNTVRLELGRTLEFPRGSVSRAYLLRLPLHRSGAIDESALLANPWWATVRRFWPSQADRVGRLAKCGCDWCLCFGCEGSEATYVLEASEMRMGAMVSVVDPAGVTLPFVVASVRRQTTRDLPS